MDSTRTAFLLSLVLLAARMAYVQWLSPYGLGPDEAQYWHWLTHADGSYATKPPLTTALIGLSTALLGHTVLGVKLFALISQSFTPFILFLITQKLAPATAELRQGFSAPWLAYMLAAISPLLAAGGLLMSPDAVMLPLWLLAILGVLHLQNQTTTHPQSLTFWEILGFKRRSRVPVEQRGPSSALSTATEAAAPAQAGTTTLAPWAMLGVLIGLAGLAKYTAVLFFPLLALYALIHRRQWFTQRGPYLAAAIALVLQAPVIYWNATHDWAGLHHLLWQTDGGGDTRHGGLGTMVNFLLGQLGVLGPVGFLGILGGWRMVLAQVQQRAHTLTAAESPPFPQTPPNAPVARARITLTYLTLPIFLAFTLQTLGAKVQPNWPLLATVPALPLAALFLTQNFKKVTQYLVYVGLFVTIIASLILHHTPAARAMGIPLRIKTDPTKDMLAAPQLGQLVGTLFSQIQSDSYLLTTRYQTTAQLAFHARKPNGQHIPTFYLNPGDKRLNQYDFWPWPNLENKLVVYLNTTPNLPPAVAQKFRRCQPWQVLQTGYGPQVPLSRSYTWLCVGGP